jgi:regulator of protease activity HflC (stomatin/prohibitin superfamily)
MIFFVIGLTLLVVLGIALDSFFIVNPTEMAAVRRFGQVTTPEPLPSGLYFKLPFFDRVDVLQVSLDTFKIEELVVYTIDNQPVTISVSMSYRIPKEAVLRLMYQVGRAGSVDIAENVRPVLSDRIARIFAKTNTTKISEQREQIGNDIRQSVRQSLSELFGLEVADLQISAVRYSAAFEASVEAAVKAKNEAIAAENTVKRIQFEGEQKVVTAKAEAEALVAKAEADKQAKILAAEAEAKAIELEGLAKANALQLQAEAIKNNPEMIELTKAQNWNGALPQTILGSVTPLLNVGDLTKIPTSQP